jgi:methionyl aminopeptidase
MIYYKTPEEIEILRESSLLVGSTLAELAAIIKPGLNTKVLDQVAEEFIRDHGAVPGFKGYQGFPNTLCISINEQVVHGIPSDREIQEGDLISIDCGTIKNGFYGDSAYSFSVVGMKQEVQDLVKRTKEALYVGIQEAKKGKRVGDIGYHIQQYVESFGYGVVRELVGHGLGRSLHEDPPVPNYGRRGKGNKLKEGMILAIEPMITLGSRKIHQEKDGWTIRTADRKPAAHFEHDIAITSSTTEILSSFDEIESRIEKNTYLLNL